MMMRVLFAALVAGLVAGAVTGAVQIWRVSPLIQAAEVYEAKQAGGKAQAQVAQSVSAAPAKGQHEHGDGDHAWSPNDGIERIAFTFVATLIMGVAFALVLVAAVMLSGRSITPRNGAIWGLVGFVVFTLAPTAGLAPELPGMPAGDLIMRQAWWWGTAAATAAGVALLVLQQHVPLRALGVLLIALPHLIGAPHAHTQDSAVPAVLAAEFAATSIATMAVFWIVLGGALGWSMSRLQENVDT
jgi:cobalt transporter subunit CbtA